MPRFFDKFDDDIRRILLAQIRNLWTHSSTAIEGNTLTLGETAFIIEEGLTVSGKSLKDHQQIIGHARAIELVYKFLEKEEVVESDLFELHRSVLAEHIVDVYAPVGAWKNEPNFTNVITEEGSQTWREYPAPELIPGLMRQWLSRFDLTCRTAISPDEAIKAYADLHLTFVTIHPFFDGNGRMARLLANFPVLRAGLPPVVVSTEFRREYLEAISGYQNTIVDLAGLEDLGMLPDNDEKSRFLKLCEGFVASTRALLEQAEAVQRRKGQW